LDNLKEKKLNSKIVTSCSEKTLYIFENMNKKQIRCMSSSIKDELCIVMKDNKEMMFFTKKDEKSVQNTTAMWTDSTSLVYSMKLLFDFIWSSSKTRE